MYYVYRKNDPYRIVQKCRDLLAVHNTYQMIEHYYTYMYGAPYGARYSDHYEHMHRSTYVILWYGPPLLVAVTIGAALALL